MTCRDSGPGGLQPAPAAQFGKRRVGPVAPGEGSWAAWPGPGPGAGTWPGRRASPGLEFAGVTPGVRGSATESHQAALADSGPVRGPDGM